MSDNPKKIALCRTAWAAYRDAVGGLSHSGDPLPEWESLGERQKRGWMVVIAHVALELILTTTPPKDTPPARSPAAKTSQLTVKSTNCHRHRPALFFNQPKGQRND